MTQPVEYEQVTYNTSSGAQMGTSTTYKIGFYGAAPIVQPVNISTASTYVVSTSVGISGFATADMVTSLVAQLSSIVVGLKALGLFGS